jgi:hypothetical protein
LAVPIEDLGVEPYVDEPDDDPAAILPEEEEPTAVRAPDIDLLKRSGVRALNSEPPPAETTAVTAVREVDAALLDSARPAPPPTIEIISIEDAVPQLFEIDDEHSANSAVTIRRP